MKHKLKQTGLVFLLLTGFFPHPVKAQLCEPIYNAERIHIPMSPSGQLESSNYNLIASVGQPAVVMNATNNYFNSVATGFFSNYLTEPTPPLITASDGDYQDMVFVEWDIEGDRTGPPVISDQAQLFRNGFVLATLPMEQTQYMDFNVFPGMTYTYGVSLENDMGTSHTDGDVGFLNPNGIITGHISTPSGNPVPFTKVKLTPNLGRSAKFDGDGYIYWFDEEINTNRQFSGLEESYTIETWFRSVNSEDQVFFSLTDSAGTTNLITLGLTAEGHVLWEHRAEDEDVMHQILSNKSHTGPGTDWHHLAAVYADSNQSMTLYVDGFLAGENDSGSKMGKTGELMLGKRGPRNHTDYFYGRLDDVRIWSFAREWDDLRTLMDITLAGDEEGLAAYWKFDEVEGENIFDLTSNDIDGNTCRVSRDDYLAPVYLGALSNINGDYTIRGIYYGSGTTFTVSPAMASPIGRSLQFDGTDDYLAFAGSWIDFNPGFTLEGWLKCRTDGDHTVLAAVDPTDDSHQLKIAVNNGKLTASYFNTSIETETTIIDNMWHHFAIVSDTVSMELYLDGSVVGSDFVTGAIPQNSEYVIGRDSPLLSSGYYQGRLDEFRVWQTVRTPEMITGTMNQTLEGDEYGLVHYWRMNEGVDSLVADVVGSNGGTLYGSDEIELKTTWSRDIPLNEYFEHWYEPETRQASLNTSNTAVDMVDFTDESMIPVSGYVRYENTACFQQGVEIYLDDAPLIPPLYTDSEGRFVVEMEPGRSGAILTAVYGVHEFIPPFIELPTVTQPLAGIFFNDNTTYLIDGVVAGGSCKYPITPWQGDIEVTFSSVNGCVEKTVIPDMYGNYESPDLPPLIYNVSVYHPNPDVDDFFTADTLDLTDGNRTREFIYHSPPQVTIVELPETEVEDCPLFTLVLRQRQVYQAAFEVYEPYGENRCLINAFDLEVFDNISDTTYAVSLSGEGTPHIQFTANKVNLLDGGQYAYQNNIQMVITDSLGRSCSSTIWAFVEGDEKIPGVNFSTTTSKTPWYVLRVPPGDGSTTTFSTSETICFTETFSFEFEASEHMNNTFHLGSKINIVATAGVGVQAGTVSETETKWDLGANLSMEQKDTDIDEESNCLTTSEEYSTSGDGMITGDDATVFIGGGYTMDLGLARYIWYDPADSTVKIDTMVTQNKTGVASTYLHSKYYIKNVLMPDLWEIYTINDDSSALADYNYWQTILRVDSLAILGAITNDTLMIGPDGQSSNNISFDAGASLQYSYETTHTSSNTTTLSLGGSEEFNLETGLEILGHGWDLDVGFSCKETSEWTEKTDTTKTRTIGFVLDDDDPGDGFAFTVKQDIVWGMPVFQLIGGQSSCPWELGTLKRQLAQMAVSPSVVVDIPPDEPAIFTLNVGNVSETGEDQYYNLSVLNETNPYGATILMNGQNLADGIDLYVPAGQSMDMTLEVYRGPEVYEYENIDLILSPPCEADINSALSTSDVTNSDHIVLSAFYQEPCSESNIASPEDGWLLDSSHGSDTLWVTVDGYTFPPDTFTTSVDLQYRSAVGGDWFTAYSVSTDSLIEDYVLMPFDISPSIVIDGGYELRAQSQCTGGKYPGTSAIVSGYIDRTAPQVLGLPEPVDGILGPDDVIRVTFNEDVACGEISPGAGDLMLYNTVTGNPMDYNYTCGGNVITFEPNVQNMFIENQIFRGEIHSLKDFYGNDLPPDEPIIWEFYVNRNPVEWNGTDVDNMVIHVDEEYSTLRQLENNGGSNRSWEIIGGREGGIPSGEPLDIPVWLNVSPMGGTLTPGATQDVTISLLEDLNFGQYSTTVYAAGTMGDEPMVVNIRKLCYEPQWSVSAADYQYSMTITATMETEGGLSDDVFDRIVVLYGEEIRGVGEVNYVPALEDLPNTHAYEVFLTIYSNEPTGEEMSLRVWDASECMELGWIELGWADGSTEFTFVSNEVLGTPTMPEVIFATSQVISELNYPSGWTWFSLNLENEDMSVNNLMANMSPSDGDIIRDQVNFSQFVSEYNGNEINEWVGTLTEVDNQSMIMMNLTNADTLEMVGYAVDTELDTIEITSGWNWIGYTPQVSYPIGWAFNSLPSATGDIVKNQFAFAQFVEGLGWIGNLTYMDPKLGYMLKSYYSGQLLYPFYDQPPARMVAEADFEIKLTESSPDWNVIPQDYEFSMNMTGQLFTHDSLSTDIYDMVGAFVDGECRGMAQPVYIEALDQYLLFMTVYSNETDSEQIEFQSYDADLDEMLYVDETVEFASNAIIGTVEEPFPWDARYLGIGDPGYIPEEFSLAQNYPNPFNPVTTIAYGLPEASDVTITIYNIMGQQVATLVKSQQEPGYYFIRWNSRNDYGVPVSAGIYLYQIRANNFVKTKKLVLLK